MDKETKQMQKKLDELYIQLSETLNENELDKVSKIVELELELESRRNL